MLIKLGKIDKHRPEPEEVRIEVHANGINRADIVQRRGFYPPPPGFDARIPGMEYAGVVAEAGDRVQGLAAGDAVMSRVGGGAYAELLVVHQREPHSVTAGGEVTEEEATTSVLITSC